MDTTHYDETYFKWQKVAGEIGGRVDLFKFRGFIKPSDTVLDFGCGGGFILKNLDCKRKIGVEINRSARDYAQSQGIEVVESVDQVEDGTVDVAISHHALEHVQSPIDTLTKIKGKLKHSSLIVLVVPHDRVNVEWRADDINMHLYTWNPMTLGNLFVTAGYAVDRIDVIRHRWPYHYDRLYKLFGDGGFDFLCRVTARTVRNYQIRIIASPSK